MQGRTSWSNCGFLCFKLPTDFIFQLVNDFLKFRERTATKRIRVYGFIVDSPHHSSNSLLKRRKKLLLNEERVIMFSPFILHPGQNISLIEEEAEELKLKEKCFVFRK